MPGRSYLPTQGVSMMQFQPYNLGKKVGEGIKKGVTLGAEYGKAVSTEKAAAARKLAKQKIAEKKALPTKTQISFGPTLPVSPGKMPAPVNRGKDAGKFESNPAYGKWKGDARKFNSGMSMQRVVQGHSADLGDSATKIPGKTPPPKLSRSKASQTKAMNEAQRIEGVRNTNIQANQQRQAFQQKWHHRSGGAAPSGLASDSARIHHL